MAHCIKCKIEYKDVDDYYCPPCLEEKNRIAKEIDAKFAGRIKEHVVSREAAILQQGGTKSIQNGIEVTTYRDNRTSQLLGR